MQIAGQTYIVGLHEDVTERDALEMKVREQERLANVGTTAVRLTHEIGNRLNGLSTSIQLLERQLHRQQSPDRALLSETVSDLKGESDRMIAFLQDLRTLARAYRLNLLPLDLAPLLRETLRTYEPLCRRNNIAIVEVVPVSLAVVPADRERCSEVLHHLLSNAIEAMPDGGTLTIGLREDEQYIAVSIHDTGRGIPGDVDVFAPFVSTKPGGTGLGLTIAQQLVQAHQGTLGFTSAPNQGTTFIVRLPRAVVASQNESSQAFSGERVRSDRVKIHSVRGGAMRSTLP
jgi:signal transduction histidine kinase